MTPRGVQVSTLVTASNSQVMLNCSFYAFYRCGSKTGPSYSLMMIAASLTLLSPGAQRQRLKHAKPNKEARMAKRRTKTLHLRTTRTATDRPTPLHHHLPLRLLPLRHCLFTGRQFPRLPLSKTKHRPRLQTLWLPLMTLRACLLAPKPSGASLARPLSHLHRRLAPTPLHHRRLSSTSMTARMKGQPTRRWTCQFGTNLIPSANHPRRTRYLPSMAYRPTHLSMGRMESDLVRWMRCRAVISISRNT